MAKCSHAAHEATSGRRAHQTYERFGVGNGVIGVRSRKLSMTISAIGSQRSMSRVSAICGTVRFYATGVVSAGRTRPTLCKNSIPRALWSGWTFQPNRPAFMEISAADSGLLDWRRIQ